MAQNKAIGSLTAMAASGAANAAHQLLARDPSAAANARTQSIRFDVLMGALKRLGGVYDITDPRFGADGGDDTDAILACISAAPAGSTILLPPQYAGSVSGSIPVSKALRFVMDGATLTQAASNTGLFTGTASGCEWYGGTLVGPQFAIQRANENAINVTGTSAASPATNIVVRGVTLRNFGMHGVYLQYVEEFDVSRNRITDCYYAGVLTCSTIGGTIHANRVRNIIGASEAYGIAISRLSTSSLVTDPRSANITVTGNVVRDVPNWEGIDTHAGQGITIAGNRVYGCYIGILVGPQKNGAAVYTYAPIDVTVTGNTVDSGLTTGAALYGISFTGAAGTPGSPVDLAYGAITGNVVRGYGEQSNSIAGAIYTHDTRGLVMSGNTVIEPSPHGIYIGHDSYDFVCVGNQILDQWSTSYGFPAAITVSDDYVKGIVSGNRNGAGTKSATNVRVFGLRLGASMPNSSVQVGPNSFDNAATPYSIGTPGALVSIANASPIAIGTSGTAIKSYLSATATWDPPSVAAGAQTTTTVAVSGAVLGDPVTVGFSLQLQTMQLTGYVSTAGTVTVVLQNGTAGAIDLGSGTLRVGVWQH